MILLIKLIVISSAIGIIISRTTLLEKIKKFLLDRNKLTFIVKLLDCPLCSSFWSGVIISLIVVPEEIFFISLGAALLSYSVSD